MIPLSTTFCRGGHGWCLSGRIARAMATLAAAEADLFLHLVVEVAIIRPGPIVGDMVHPISNARAGREPVIPLHPSLEPVLGAHAGRAALSGAVAANGVVAAGFTGGQAEELRRARASSARRIG